MEERKTGKEGANRGRAENRGKMEENGGRGGMDGGERDGKGGCKQRQGRK